MSATRLTVALRSSLQSASHAAISRIGEIALSGNVDEVERRSLVMSYIPARAGR